MTELSGTPVVKAIREMMRNQEILDKMRDVFETARARDEISSKKYEEYITIIESVEREMTESEGGD